MSKSLPSRARQVIFPSVGVIENTDIAIPTPGPDDLLLRVALVGICATDLHLLDGHIGDPFPLVPGHEFVGEVAAIGTAAADRRGLAVGDHVAVEMLLPCQSCDRCREGRYNLCDGDDMGLGLARGREYGVNIPRTVEPGLWGGYAEYLYVPREAIVHRLSPTLPWAIAVLVEPLAVAFRAVSRARIAPGERVVVIGPGPVGLLAVAAAQSAGAGSVTMIGTRQNRLELAGRFGAELTINAREQDARQALLDSGGLADVVIEIAGATSAQQQAVTLVRRGGRVVLAGACGADAPVTFRADEDLLTREIDLLPSFLSAGGFEPSISLLERGGFPFSELVTHRFPLDEVERAFAVVAGREDNVLKAVLDPRASEGVAL
ncbi:MAG: alcohol dehydrogenase catalytic domain-containing protein [Lacisediminihabitans sp.]